MADEKTKTKAYRVMHPHPDTHPVLAGQAFDGGVLVTDDAAIAMRLTEYGCQVSDAETGKPALGTGKPEEQARIDQARRWAFQR